LHTNVGGVKVCRCPCTITKLHDNKISAGGANILHAFLYKLASVVIGRGAGSQTPGVGCGRRPPGRGCATGPRGTRWLADCGAGSGCAQGRASERLKVFGVSGVFGGYIFPQKYSQDSVTRGLEHTGCFRSVGSAPLLRRVYSRRHAEDSTRTENKFM